MHFISSQGLAWIEVKAHEPFDLYSSQWLGNPGHYKGMPPTLATLNHDSNTVCCVIRASWSRFSYIVVCSIGLQQQAEEQLQVAQAPCNSVKWRSPTVVTHFPQGWHPAVKAELNVRQALAT